MYGVLLLFFLNTVFGQKLMNVKNTFFLFFFCRNSSLCDFIDNQGTVAENTKRSTIFSFLSFLLPFFIYVWVRMCVRVCVLCCCCCCCSNSLPQNIAGSLNNTPFGHRLLRSF